MASTSKHADAATGFPEDARFRNFVSHSAQQSPVASKRGLAQSSLSSSAHNASSLMDRYGNAYETQRFKERYEKKTMNKINQLITKANKEEFARSRPSASID